ncbi:hypothetical protein IU443_22310 [Nocardia farcinica]|uniref:Uncharacterized protein n=1 Tax=Nocardia farcinica TaxID=37329 RepID=A0A0H5NQR7_NOCFR|nr:hypothetical protein [Nocardia farcinica]AXK85977.1 hypothetical protein DXT66_10425 [Nocardia farcinica]MBF6068335.1 hypothetical protein [Nocardia farcinica]MBF6140594.1 hypothetical protein [Nocardia farcinica]MBF6257600.1 hypothetical protein [Nocardia farcinica]MBF6263529.1 hypothetical protein [Nocardia farcinica]
MTDTSGARTRLARELGADPAALAALSEAHCADLLGLLAAAPDRDRDRCAPELRATIETLPRPYRPVVRRVFLGRWR